MAAKVSFRMTWDRPAIAALKTDPEVAHYVGDAAEGLAALERSKAPHRTGAGAESIQARPAARAKGADDVGWDLEHYYMSYQELGTKYVSRKNFAGQALEQYKTS